MAAELVGKFGECSTGKVRFIDERRAPRKAWALEQYHLFFGHRQSFYVYRCPECECWHLTRQRRTETAKARDAYRKERGLKA